MEEKDEGRWKQEKKEEVKEEEEQSWDAWCPLIFASRRTFFFFTRFIDCTRLKLAPN